MATIKLEIFLDSNEQNDVTAFSNLMNAFSGTPSVQMVGSKQEFPLGALKRTVEAQSPSTQVSDTEAEQIAETTDEEYQNGYEYSEAEMLKLPNTDLKDYVTGLGIDWAKAEGKNTNRKLTDLVLAFREGVASPAEEKELIEQVDNLQKENSTETTGDLTAEDEAEESKITYDDLKVSLGKKVDQHRDAIVAKLGEFGAKKMPNLDEKHWEAMFNFMEAL